MAEITTSSTGVTLPAATAMITLVPIIGKIKETGQLTLEVQSVSATFPHDDPTRQITDSTFDTAANLFQTLLKDTIRSLFDENPVPEDLLDIYAKYATMSAASLAYHSLAEAPNHSLWFCLISPLRADGVPAAVDAADAPPTVHNLKGLTAESERILEEELPDLYKSLHREADPADSDETDSIGTGSDDTVMELWKAAGN
jgi:hypothetical protein